MYAHCLQRKRLVPSMAIGDLLHSMSTLVLTCTRHVSRASRKLGRVLTGRKPPAVPSLLRRPCPRRRRQKKQQLATSTFSSSATSTTAAAAVEGSNRIVEGEDGLWRRTILLGERCQPLDFSGAIHYDSRGRRLAEPAPRRSGSPLSSFAYRPAAVFSAETAAAASY